MKSKQFRPMKAPNEALVGNTLLEKVSTLSYPLICSKN